MCYLHSPQHSSPNLILDDAYISVKNKDSRRVYIVSLNLRRPHRCESHESKSMISLGVKSVLSRCSPTAAWIGNRGVISSVQDIVG